VSSVRSALVELTSALAQRPWLLVLALLVVVVGTQAVLVRPQRGLLLLAALIPFDGLLLILPGGDALGPWKEGLLAVVLLASLVAPQAARRSGPGELPGWVPAAVAFAALGLVSAVVVGGIVGFWGMKIGYLYLLVPLVLWRCPFSRAERDRLVTILMATGLVTAVIGLAQQAAGPERLNALGYDYNTTIRFAGGLLRSFSTFTQPFSFGFFLTLVLLVCLPTAMSDTRRPRNLVFLAGTPVLVVGMAASVVRGAFLGLAVGLLFLAAWRFRGLLHLVPPALLALLLLPATVAAAFTSASSLGERSTGWGDTLDRVAAAPFGNGLGVTGASAEKSIEQGAQLSDVMLLGGVPYQPDSQFVKTLLELGPLGLWLLLLLGTAGVMTAVGAARTSHGTDRALAQGVAASIVGAAAASMVSTYLEIFPLDFYFWLLLGVLLCYDPPSTSTHLRSAPAEAVSRPTSASSSVR
jgi:hypothetical protein